MSSSIWPVAPTLVSTAVSFIAPLRAAVGSVFASSGTITQTVHTKSSSSKTKVNKVGDDGERGNGDRESDGGAKRPPGDGGAGGDGADGADGAGNGGGDGDEGESPKDRGRDHANKKGISRTGTTSTSLLTHVREAAPVAQGNKGRSKELKELVKAMSNSER